MKVVMERMGGHSAAAGQSNARLDLHFRGLDSAIAALEAARRERTGDDGGAANPFDPAEVERWLAASYTTESERRVLAAALYGQALPIAQPSFAGNEVELF